MGFNVGRALSGLVEGLKGAYFFFEDKYYALLDVINEKIPVYRIVDPIDNIVPTFVLFIAAFVGLFIGLFFLLQPVNFTAIVHVVDADGNPIAGQSVVVTFEGVPVSFLTDENGVFEFSLKQSEESVTLVVEAEGFERFEKELLLVAGNNNVVSLVKSAGPLMFSGPFNISVVDSSGVKITDVAVTVRFVCSLSADAAPEPITNSNGLFVVSSSAACGDLFASFVAAGFEPKNNVLISRESEEVVLNKLDNSDSTGTINVVVMDVSNNPVPAALVSLFDNAGVKQMEDSTDASGMVVFEKVAPDTYDLSASTDDGRSARKAVSVEPGGKSSVTLLLPDAVDSGKGILVKLVDSNTNEPLNGVSASFFDGNSFFKSAVSDSHGIISLSVAPADANAVFSVVLSHPSYVLRVVEGLVVSKLSIDPVVYSLEKLALDGSNYASLKVFVVNEQNAAVPGALVSLFMDGFENPLFETPKIADDNGMVLFNNLPLVSFKAYAQKQSFDEDFSPLTQLNANSVGVAFVSLVLGRGAFKAHIFDLSGNPVEGANVGFFELVSNALLDSGNSDSSGFYMSKPIKANKNVYLHITASGFLPQNVFLPQTTNPFTVIKDINRDVNVTLYRVAEVDKTKELSFKFVGLFKEDNSPAAILQPNTSYLAKFNLVLPDDLNYSNVVMHVRAGLDEQLNAVDSVAVLRNVNAPLLPDIVLSQDFSPANPFSNQNPVESDKNAKQVNVSWQKLEKGVYEVVAKIFVKPGLAVGTPVELHYQAKAVIDSNAVLSDVFLQRFKVGENVCTQNCPSFEWSFELESEGGRIVLDSSKKTALVNESDYNLFYKIYNLGETGFSGSELTASIPNNGILSFIETNQPSLKLFSAMKIPANTVVGFGLQSPAKLHSNVEAAFVDLNLVLSTTPLLRAGDNSNKVSLPFSVLAGSELMVELPQSVPQNAFDLTIRVRDKETENLLNEAFVWVLPDKDLSISTAGAVRASKIEGQDGEYLVSFGQGFAPKDFISVKVSAPGHKTFFGRIPVTGETTDFSSGFDYSCLKIDAKPDTLEFDDSVTIERPKQSRQVSILVSANSCESDSVVSVTAPVYLSDRVRSEAEKSLGKNASTSFIITVDNSVPQGKIPLILTAKFTDDAFRRRLKGVSLIVTDSSSCFAMISKTDSAQALNITESTKTDFLAGNLDKIDADSVPGELSILLERGSEIAGLGNGWFAVPGTDKVFVFHYPVSDIKVFNAPGVKPDSGIAGAAGYFGVVATDNVFASRYDDAGPETRITRNAIGTRTNSRVVPVVSGTKVFFATVAEGNRAYIWQADSDNFDILELGGVGSESTIVSKDTYFTVVGDSNSFSWDARHVSNETNYPLRSFATIGTTKSSPIAVSGNYFATVGTDAIYVWNASADAFSAKNAPEVHPQSRIIASENTVNGYFFVSAKDNFYSLPATGASITAYSLLGLQPESNIASSDYYFAVAAPDTVYAGYKDKPMGGSDLNAFNTPGVIPNSNIVANVVSQTKNYFSVAADGVVYTMRFGSISAPQQYALSGISSTSSMIAPLLSSFGAWFFIVGNDHSFLWKNNAQPADFATTGTSFFSTIGFDSDSKNIVVSSNGNVFLLNEQSYFSTNLYPLRMIELPATGYRSKISVYKGNFAITGTDKLYSVAYDYASKTLSKTEFGNTEGINIPKYASLATYTSRNYSLANGANATIINVSWQEKKPLQTGITAQYSTDNGITWNNVINQDNIYRTASQIMLRFLLLTTSELVSPALLEFTIKYSKITDALFLNKFVFNINHSMDTATMQNKCYGFVNDVQLPALNVTAGIEPSSIFLHYEPMPKLPSTKLTELYQFPAACMPSATGDTVECAAANDNTEDTFVSEVNILGCKGHSVAANYQAKSFGDNPYLIDAKQRIIISQTQFQTEQDCMDYTSSNYALFKFKPGFLSSLPADQKRVRLRFYSNNESIASHELYQPQTAWTETTTWLTKPATGNDIGGLYYLGNNWWEIDITDIYKAWKDNPETNNGLYIISNSNLPLQYNDNFPAAAIDSFSFYSSNNPDTTKRPRLVFGTETDLDIDTRGMLDFEVSNNSLVGEENYALLDFNDYAWQNGKLVTYSDKFNVQLQASNQQTCAMPDNVYGKTGEGALPNVLFSWQWKNNALSSTGNGVCDQNTQNYVYCDSTQFSIELLQKINAIMELAKQSGKQEEIKKYLSFNAYLMKDGYGTDFRKDFNYYMINVATYDTPQFYKDSMYGLFKYFGDESRWKFNSDRFDNSGNKVLAKPGLYQINLTFDFENGQFVFFNGISEPSATINITMTLQREAANPNPLYEMPFDGQIGFTKRPDEQSVSRQNYGMAFSGEQNVYLVNNAEESIKTTSVPSNNASNNLAVSRDASFEALNSTDLRGGLLLVKSTDNSLKFLQTSATPVVMQIDSIDNNARGYYKIEQITNPATNETKPLSFTNYGNVWTGIFSTMSCKDFSGNNLFFNMPDKNANYTGESCKEKNYSNGFKWLNVQSNKTILLRTVFFAPQNEQYLLKPACAGQTKFLSPYNVANSGQQDSFIDLSFSKQKWSSLPDSISSVFEMVKEGKACVSSPAKGELFFWWNPQFLEQELLPEAQNYYSIYQLLPSGTLLCNEQSTEQPGNTTTPPSSQNSDCLSSLPVYRFWNKSTNGHAYTISETEKANMLNNSSWVYEGIDGYMFDQQKPNTVPLYHFWSARTNDNFYTISESEKAKLLAISSWAYQGPSGYVYAQQNTNTTSLYRFWNNKAAQHFFTTKESQKTKLTQDVSWNYEGIAGYVCYSQT